MPGRVADQRHAQEQDRLNVQGQYENFLSVSTFIENPFDKIPFAYVPPEATEGRLRSDVLFSYLALYMNVRRVREIVLKPKQGVGWFNAGEKLAEKLRKLPALVALFTFLSIKFLQLFWDIARNKDTDLRFADVFSALSGKPLGKRQVPGVGGVEQSSS